MLAATLLRNDYEVGHDALAGGPLGAVDCADPPGTDVAVGDVGHVEGLALAVRRADDENAFVGVDRDHIGRASIKPLGLVVDAGELPLVAGAELLLHLGEGIGIGGAAVTGEPGERLTLGVEQPDGAGLGVDRPDGVAGVATRPAGWRRFWSWQRPHAPGQRREQGASGYPSSGICPRTPSTFVRQQRLKPLKPLFPQPKLA
jgi:hypothetical protein